MNKFSELNGLKRYDINAYSAAPADLWTECDESDSGEYCKYEDIILLITENDLLRADNERLRLQLAADKTISLAEYEHKVIYEQI